MYTCAFARIRRACTLEVLTEITAKRSSLEAIDADTPPQEFRIFKAGVNDSTQGPTLFDAQAARDVMADYSKRGTDYMIDLDHGVTEPAFRSDSHDARGWFKLELRGGDLWAVDVRWTPDGLRRLSEKTQRYISPLFAQHKKTGRVTRLLNVALCAMPATLHAQPLVAASARITPTGSALQALSLILQSKISRSSLKT